MLPSFESRHMLNPVDESLAAIAWDCLSLFESTVLVARECGPRLPVCFSILASGAFCQASPATAAALAAHDPANWGLKVHCEA